MPTSRPRVFLSSTIYDFADLRSSLKFWLEELGHEVNASEHNDFPRDPNENTYEACFKAIDESDYFILLIGGRAGGWYDENKRVTITMAEYRRAYERVKEGRLKILAFVRKSVWDVREDRKDLESIVRQLTTKKAISANDASAIRGHESSIVRDADVIFDFLKEVARNAEMKAAVTGGPLPLANWIHQFSAFRDIVDALRMHFVGAHGLRRAALTANLRHELMENLRVLFAVSKNGEPGYALASSVRQSITNSIHGVTQVDEEGVQKLKALETLATTRLLKRFHLHALQEAVLSGEFLEFNSANDRYESGVVQRELLRLRDCVDRITQEKEFRQSVFAPGAIPNKELLLVMSLYDRLADLVMLSGSVLRMLDGKSLSPAKLSPTYPFPDAAAMVATAKVSDEVIEAWIARQAW